MFYFLHSDELRDPVSTYNPTTIQQLNEATPSIDWTLLVSQLHVSNVTVETIIVESPAYLQNIGKLVAETDIMTIRYHFTNVLIFSIVNSLSKTIRGPNNRLSAILNGNKVVPLRWKTCIRATGGILGQLVGRYYALAKFGVGAQNYADAFLHTIRDSLEERLQALDFLDDVTKQKSLDKVRVLSLYCDKSSRK
jgi:predicted metalloendopeptidase